MAKSVPFVLTDHAEERMLMRRITRDMVSKALEKPDRKENESDGDIEHIRTINGRQLHVIAFYKADQKKWIVKSTWVRGEEDQKSLKWVADILGWIRRLLKSWQKSRR
jgi:hypothetical protein